MNLIQTQKFAENLAMRAGKILLKKFGKSKIVTKKIGADFATDADLLSEKLIVGELQKHFPNCGILAEESFADFRSCAENWIIDPLDGTKNFHFGIPFWCVSLALQVNGESVVGVVYAPISQQLFSARKGGGAKLNGRQIQVSATAKIFDSTIVVEIPRRVVSGVNFQRDVTNFTRALAKVRRVRAFAAAAYDLALVASGAVDGYLDFSRSTKIWDIAAGELIVREAGGGVSCLKSVGTDPHAASVLASNGKLHESFVKICGHLKTSVK